MEVFNRNHFVIAFSKNNVVQNQSLTRSNKNSLKMGTIVDYYKMTYPTFKQLMLYERTSQCIRGLIWHWNNYDELGHVAHGVH